MPIPPRPSQHNRRPARSSTTRKVVSTHLNNLQAIQSNQPDWRAEVALLSEFGSKSFPAGSGRMQIVEFKHAIPASQEKVASASTNEGRTEVNLEGLIAQSRGKREKRATTATTLGFDFITTPSVLALPDTALEATSSASASAFASSSKSQLGKAAPTTTAVATATLKKASDSPALSLAGTPTTPALLVQRSSDMEEEEEEEDDDDDEWEHIHIPSSVSAGQTKMEEDEDVIVLGELDLDELDIINGNGDGNGDDEVVVGGKGERERTSYAAALGAAKVK